MIPTESANDRANNMNGIDLYNTLKECLRKEAVKADLLDELVSIKCKVLTAREAIGDPEHRDYPILVGKESMVEAEFIGSKGQAFADDYQNIELTIGELLKIDLDNNKNRSTFIAAYNAIFRYLGLCEKTIHCRDEEPVECASKLSEAIPLDAKVLLIGFQPRFLEYLAEKYQVRAIDLDKDNIGTEKFGVMIEPPEATDAAIEWCDYILATGSTIANGSVTRFVNTGKPTIFYGTSIAAPAISLGLTTYCQLGH